MTQEVFTESFLHVYHCGVVCEDEEVSPSFLPSKGGNVIALLYAFTSVLKDRSGEGNNTALPKFVLKIGCEKKDDKVSVLL